MAPSPTFDQRLGQLATRRWFAPLLAALLLVAALWVMTRAWDASLLDRYQFRQTQTALTAYWMQHEGFHLAYPLPIFGPPWSVPHEFPLYQWLVAVLAQGTGLSLVSSARVVGIIFFLLTLPAVYGLASWVEPDRRRRLLVPAAVLVTPICLFYSRTFMIESCACALAVWFLYAHFRNLRHTDWRWTLATTVLGVLAALVKITTFAPFGLVAMGYSAYQIWHAGRRVPGQPDPGRGSLILACVVPALVALAAGIWWIAFSDALKRANPYAEMLTSANLRPWIYGALSQRWDPVFWRLIGRELALGVLSAAMLLLLLVGFVVIASRYRRAALLCVGGFLIGPLLFSNLHAVHEYYFFPSALFAAAAAGLVLAGVMASPRLGTSIKGLVLAAFFILQAANFNRYYAITLRTPPVPPPPLAELIRLATPEDGVVLIHGWDWNTLLPYYAQRRAILVPSGREENPDMLLKVLAQLRPVSVSALVIAGPHQHDLSFIQWRTGQLNLSDTPVAKSADGDLYLPASAVSALAAKATNPFRFPGVTLNFTNPPATADPRLHYQKVDPAAYAPVASPAPFAVFNPWTVDVTTLEGKPTLFANAPSELHFHAPPGATRIEAVVGLDDRSYVAPNATDGVDVVIFELLPSGGHRVLFRRNLNPLQNPADRGPQSITVEGIGPISGPLVFAISPGPADNMSYDWSYWRAIRIH